MSSKKSQKSKILLVEGNDDQHVSWSLFNKHAIPEVFDVIDSGGISNLFLQLPVRFKQSEVDTIGVVIDADTNLASRWQQLRSIVAKEEIILPDVPPQPGAIIHGAKRFGVWVMPNNQVNGMLEDFMTFLIRPNDPLLPIANETLDRIEQQNLNNYIPGHRSKALIHTWLAWQEDPGTPMGSAITKRYLDSEIPICQAFLTWITTLFT